MRFLLLSVLVVFLVGIMVPNAFAQIYITDDATGGGCTTIGTWDSASKTCTLTSDVSEPITIDSDGITLDGNNHTVTMPDKIYNQNYENGVSSSNHKDLTIKNFNIVCPENYNCGSGVHVHGQTVSDSSLDTYGTLNVDNITIEQNNFSGQGMFNGITTDIMGWSNNYVSFAPPVNLIIKNNYIENCCHGGADYYAAMSIGTTSGAEIFGNTIIWTDTSIPLTQRGQGIVGGGGEGAKIYDNVIDGVDIAFQPSNGQMFFENEIKNVYRVTENWSGNWDYDVINNNIQNYEYASNDTFPPHFDGNYWANHDTENEGCADTDYDNICEGGIHGDANSWNIPNGWDTTITTNESITDQEATSNSGAAVTFSAPVAEKSGQSVSVTCSPSSGSIFSLGTTQVICQTSEGRTSGFSITVVDTVAPILTVPADISADTSVPQGVTVDFSGVSATDVVGLANPASCDKESGDLFPIGDTVVTCTASDTSGNTSTGSFTITVVSDTPPPIITVPSNLIVDAQSSGGTNVDYSEVTAADPLGVTDGPTCDYQSGSFFNVGTTTVTCTATNTPGFVSTETFTVTVNPPPSITNDIWPTSGQIGYSWQHPTNVSAYDELDNSRGYSPDDFLGFVEYTWRGYMKGYGYDTNILDLYIYRFNSANNAESFYSGHVNYWQNRGGYAQWLPNAGGVGADECYGRVTAGWATDKISLYCVKNEIVVLSTVTGYEWEMKDELLTFADSTFDNLSNIEPQSESTADNTAPTVTVPADITVVSPDGSDVAVTFDATAYFEETGSSYSLEVTFIDVSLNITGGCSKPNYTSSVSGSNFPVGTTTVTCMARDASGNEDSETFTVTVTNAAAEAEPEPEVEPEPEAEPEPEPGSTSPPAPGSVVSSASDSQVTLTWSPPSDDGGAAITDYLVEYATAGSDLWLPLNDGTSTATSATITGLTNGQQYNFRISAVNSVGIGDASQPVNATPSVEPEAEPEVESEVEESMEPDQELQNEIDILYNDSDCDSGLIVDGICQTEVCDSMIFTDGICQIEELQPEVEVTGSEPELSQQASGGCGEGTILVNGVCQLAPTQASGGCGEGTVLVDGVCQLAPKESNDGCGEGTVLVNGVCQLDKSSGASMTIEPLYLIIGVVAIGGIIGAIAVARRGSKTSKPAKQELKEYEEKYIAKEKPAKQKPAEKKEISAFCESCGKPLKPEAKFCGQCGTPRS